MLEGMISATEHKAEDGNKHYTAEFETTNNSGDTTMNDVAGLLALMQENARAAMECRITQSQKDCCCELNHRFDQLECTISTNRLADENARLARENEALKDTLRGDRIADAAVSRLERFAVNHYTPTRTAASTPAAA